MCERLLLRRSHGGLMAMRFCFFDGFCNAFAAKRQSKNRGGSRHCLRNPVLRHRLKLVATVLFFAVVITLLVLLAQRVD